MTSTDPCKDAFTGKECFGRGKCKCGRCECEEGFDGKYCQRETVRMEGKSTAKGLMWL